jgi:hypothetical protein
MLRQLLTAGFIDQVAVRKDRIAAKQATGTRYASTKGVPFRALGINEDVFVHPSSIIADQEPPDFILFTEVIRTSRLWVKGQHFTVIVILELMHSRCNNYQCCMAFIFGKGTMLIL